MRRERKCIDTFGTVFSISQSTLQDFLASPSCLHSIVEGFEILRDVARQRSMEKIHGDSDHKEGFQ